MTFKQSIDLSSIDFSILSAECNTIAENMRTLGQTLDATYQAYKQARDAKEDACGGLSYFSQECTDATNNLNTRQTNLQVKRAEYDELQEQFIDAKCQTSGNCSESNASYNFQGCFDAASAILSCSENTPEVIEECCVLDKKMEYYGDLITALHARMSLDTACVVASYQLSITAAASMDAWTNSSGFARKTLVFDGLKSAFTAACQEAVNAAGVGSVTGGTTITCKISDGTQQNTASIEQLKKVATAVMQKLADANLVASILGISMPSPGASAGKTASLAPANVTCGPIPSIDTAHFCFTQEEADDIQKRIDDLDEFLKNLMSPEVLAEKMCSLVYETVGVGANRRRIPTGFKFSKTTLTKSMDQWEAVAKQCYSHAVETYRNLNIACTQRSQETINTKNEVHVLLKLATDRKAELLAEIAEDQAEVNALIVQTMLNIIKENIVAATTFTYRRPDDVGNLMFVVDRIPETGHGKGGFVTVTDGVASLDVEAIQARFPVDESINPASTPRQLAGTADKGWGALPVTIAADVKVDISDEDLEGLHNMPGLDKLTKATVDSLINGLKNISCGKTLEFCIGQSIE